MTRIDLSLSRMTLSSQLRQSTRKRRGCRRMDSQSRPTNSGNQSYPLFVACISSSDSRSTDFSFRPVFFPTAYVVSAEHFGVEVAVSRISAGGSGIVKLFAHPSLACND